MDSQMKSPVETLTAGFIVKRFRFFWCPLVASLAIEGEEQWSSVHTAQVEDTTVQQNSLSHIHHLVYLLPIYSSSWRNKPQSVLFALLQIAQHFNAVEVGRRGIFVSAPTVPNEHLFHLQVKIDPFSGKDMGAMMH